MNNPKKRTKKQGKEDEISKKTEGCKCGLHREIRKIE